jgi:hypothetical protein
MNSSAIRIVLLLVIIAIAPGCANVVPPSGGKKDTRPPKLLSISPADSLLNTRVTKIELRFDEYLDPSIPASEITVSPLLPMPVSIMAYGRKAVLHIPDTLLKDETTYRISFGNGIKDLHEGNVFKNYKYTFSTGAYFDSLKLQGSVIDAVTGLKDTASYILLYDARKSDSAVVREKPLYVTKVRQDGRFFFEGLPQKTFRIYALRDANNNLVYDGDKEAIGFIDKIVIPADSVTDTIVFKVFVEENKDTSQSVQQTTLGKRARRNADKEDFGYLVTVDTSNINKRSLDVTKPLSINFNKEPDTFNTERMSLVYDSMYIAIDVPFTLKKDTVKETTLLLDAAWKEDKVYTLRLLKGFALDSSKAEAMPSRHTFRTKNDDDYAKLSIHLPERYNDSKYLLLVFADVDTVHNKQVTDTMVHLAKLKPASYTLKIVKDDNRNEKWDTGDLFEKRQPEEVIPYDVPVQLKAGWDNTIDFVPEEKKPTMSSPGKRDKTLSK